MPAALEQLKFEAEIDGIGVVELVADDRVGRPDPPTGAAVGGEVFVDGSPCAPRHPTRPLVPADMVASEILTLYAEVAANHPTDHPSIHDPLLQDLAVDLADRRSPDEEEAILDRWFHMDESKAALDAPGACPRRRRHASRANAFLLTNRFYAGAVAPSGCATPRPAIRRCATASRASSVDFHRYVAAPYRHLLPPRPGARRG